MHNLVMVQALELVPKQDDDFTLEDVQNLELVPHNQILYLLEQTFKSHFSVQDHCAPQRVDFQICDYNLICISVERMTWDLAYSRCYCFNN